MALFRNKSFSCKEATMLYLQKKELELSAMTKFRLFVHLSYCKCCKRFVKQSDLMDVGASRYNESVFRDPPYHLSAEARENIRKILEE